MTPEDLRRMTDGELIDAIRTQASDRAKVVELLEELEKTRSKASNRLGAIDSDLGPMRAEAARRAQARATYGVNFGSFAAEAAAANARIRDLLDDFQRRNGTWGVPRGGSPFGAGPYGARDHTYTPPPRRPTPPPPPPPPRDTAAQTKARGRIAKLLERANHPSTPAPEAASCRAAAAKIRTNHGLTG